MQGAGSVTDYIECCSGPVWIATMAEAFAVLGVVQLAISLVSYGGKIVNRMNEFNHNVKGLPESFAKIRVQLPPLLYYVQLLQGKASNHELNANTETLLVPVLEGLRKEILCFDETILKVLPSPQASNREKVAKAIKGVSIQKKIDEFWYCLDQSQCGNRSGWSSMISKNTLSVEMES